MTTADALPGTHKATRREWIGLAVLGLPCLLYSMDLNVLNLAIPHLTADLAPSASQLLWIVDIYGFLLAGFLLTMGALGDRIGRRRLLMIGAAAFGIASVLAAYSTTAEMLIFSRAVLGVAAATLAPSTLSLIRNMFLDARERTMAIGIWVGCFSSAVPWGRSSAAFCWRTSGGVRCSCCRCPSWWCCSSWYRCCCRSFAIRTPERWTSQAPCSPPVPCWP